MKNPAIKYALLAALAGSVDTIMALNPSTMDFKTLAIVSLKVFVLGFVGYYARAELNKSQGPK